MTNNSLAVSQTWTVVAKWIITGITSVREHSMAVKIVKAIGSVELADGAALLEPKSGRERHELHSTRHRHAVLVPGLEIVPQLLACVGDKR